MKTVQFLSIAITMISISLVFASCSEKKRTVLKQSERKIVDTLYKQQFDSIEHLAHQRCIDLRENKMGMLEDSFYRLNTRDIQSYYDLKDEE